MFRPTWPSSGVYDILLFIPEGICFAVFVAFVACYSILFYIRNNQQIAAQTHKNMEIKTKQTNTSK
jgi:hypothetical protein